MAKRVKSATKKQPRGKCAIIPDGEDEYMRQINPFFVEVILENILGYLKENNKSKSLGNYRLVCKFWDKEVIKQVRRETSIKLSRLLAPFPEGFGWNVVKNKNKFPYNVPYQQVRSFENVEVVLDCQWMEKGNYCKLQKWFKVMGDQVKCLIYTCTLRTYQNKHCITLERILKEWCPNLERLMIKNIRCFNGLIFTSLFEDPTKEFVCKKLTELNIKMDLEDFSSTELDKVPDFLVNPILFNRFIYNHGTPESKHQFPEIFNRAGVKVTVPDNINAKIELPDLSKIFPENFFPKYLDGGILGQLIKCTNISKFTMEGNIDSNKRKQLMAFFHYRQNNWRTSLKHLEIDLNNDYQSLTEDFLVLGKVNFPIVTLKLKIKCRLSERVSRDLARFLVSFSKTLEYLDIDNYDNLKDNNLVLPLLPKLKILILKQIGIFNLSSENIVQNAPNLEKCYLTEKDHYFGSTADRFFDGNSILINEKLKDFRLTGNAAHFSGEQASRLLNWFPKLKRLELSGMKAENIGFRGFLQKLQNSEVTYLKLSWCKESDSSLICNMADNTELIRELGKLQNLRTLEMSYDHDFLLVHLVPFCVTPIAFRDGFGQLSNLQFLKLTNFGIFLRDKDEVMDNIKHIPVVHICRMEYISETTQRRKREMIREVEHVLNSFRY